MYLDFAVWVAIVAERSSSLWAGACVSVGPDVTWACRLSVDSPGSFRPKLQKKSAICTRAVEFASAGRSAGSGAACFEESFVSAGLSKALLVSREGGFRARYGIELGAGGGLLVRFPLSSRRRVRSSGLLTSALCVVMGRDRRPLLTFRL